MVIDDRSEDFEDFGDLRLSDLSNVSSSRHWFLASWLTTNDPKIDLKVSKPDPGAKLNRVPPRAPKKKNVFFFELWGEPTLGVLGLRTVVTTAFGGLVLQYDSTTINGTGRGGTLPSTPDPNRAGGR